MDFFGLKIGDISSNGQVKIIDEDRLCFLVRSESKGAVGLRTISKQLLLEFFKLISENPEINANQARETLCGKSEVDKFEYGYASTLLTMAKMMKDHKVTITPTDNSLNSRQIIFYGAPGTGKSNHIETYTKDGNRIRTTFHPDSDYSTFVGAYKPTTKTVTVYEASGSIREEEQITYSFVPQAFLKAYVEAWKRKDGGDDSPYYLVIEEINRGNCAQIFGDLFQLLDRDDRCRSRYAIVPDDDMRRHIAKELDSCTHIEESIRTGKEMRLPENLYIWATMNTSDQSLFPIDSAFKRRWDWEYMPIEKGDKEFVIKIGNTKYDWWEFISTINEKIEGITCSEDKKLGYWFAKPANGGTEIGCKQFVSKVLFYLCNDVYKDYADSNDCIFKKKTTDGSEKTPFTTFFGEGHEERVREFMEYNGIMPLAEDTEDTEEEDATDDLAGLPKKERDYSKYRINGGDKQYGKGELVREVISYYCTQNPNMDANAVRTAWMSLDFKIVHLVETQDEFTTRTSGSSDSKKRAKPVPLSNGESIYVSTEVGSSNIQDFIDKVSTQDWNIRIEKA
ncbi:hypothetical protein E5358_09945 [Palleniella muris]|uniref:Uncharacterized protein n=1 Tax=Palleniella muris TaxID=3038145 RepID=A0AC61QPA1_9BACT|nr:hypothetical protein E5358_09945 [Palleniella muris]